VSDTMTVMKDSLGHLTGKTNARPLFSENGEQVGWVHIPAGDEGLHRNLILSILWAEYLTTPLCSHTAEDFNGLTRCQRLLHKPFVEGSDAQPFNLQYQRFYFHDNKSWHKENNSVNMSSHPYLYGEKQIPAYKDYGLIGFCLIDNEAEDLLNTPSDSAQKIELYLHKEELQRIVKEDLIPNKAFWKNKEDLWFNFDLDYDNYRSVLNYAEGLTSVYHTPTLAWDEPVISFSPYLGLFNWNYLD